MYIIDFVISLPMNLVFGFPMHSHVWGNDPYAPSAVTFDIKPSIIKPIAASKLQLDNSFWNYLYSLLKNEVPYDEILTELEGGKIQAVRMMTYTNKGMEFW